jgi:hypothetical protein
VCLSVLSAGQRYSEGRQRQKVFKAGSMSVGTGKQRGAQRYGLSRKMARTRYLASISWLAQARQGTTMAHNTSRLKCQLTVQRPSFFFFFFVWLRYLGVRRCPGEIFNESDIACCLRRRRFGFNCRRTAHVCRCIRESGKASLCLVTPPLRLL